jgi:putative AdoMet-dependent methyltransferase
MLFNERKQIGGSFIDPDRARMWDRRSAAIAGDFKERAKQIAGMLNLGQQSVIADLGCGTGQYTLELSHYCRKVYAVDISSTMLDILEEKAKKRKASNIERINSGILEFLSKDMKVDAIVTQTALHHLPDFWKSVAIHKMAGMLNPGGKIFLSDVIFSFKTSEYERFFGDMIKEIAAKGDDGLTEDAKLHLQEEFSTFDWILEGMFSNAGLRIETKIPVSPSYLAYVLRLDPDNGSRSSVKKEP